MTQHSPFGTTLYYRAKTAVAAGVLVGGVAVGGDRNRQEERLRRCSPRSPSARVAGSATASDHDG
jgi:hypothetical protein